MNQDFIQQNFCNPEISKVLKELGFNEPCFGYYDKSQFHYDDMFRSNSVIKQYLAPGYNIEDFSAGPLHQQAITWLVESHGLSVTVQSYKSETLGLFYSYHIHNQSVEMEHPNRVSVNNIPFQRMSEAASAAILKAIEILKSQQVQSK